VELAEEGGVPKNDAVGKLVESMKIVHERYMRRHSCEDALIVFVVQEGEKNTIDQRSLEFLLWEKYSIPVVRLTLAQAYYALTIQSDASLSYQGKEVTLIYFRAGYTPNDYPTQTEWKSRRIIERSRAAKCPNMGYHLAGTKKVQQVIAHPNTLARFLPDADAPSLLHSFAGLYTLNHDDATTRDYNAAADAITDSGCRNYVLKPQREGGGNNHYTQEMATILKQNITDGKFSSELKQYILMERLFPPHQTAILLRKGNLEGIGETISELGCFATIVAAGDGEEHDRICHNEYAGFLLRTKFYNVDEGGVASGFATLSSPFLC